MHYHVNVIHGGDVLKSNSKASQAEADILYNKLLDKARKENYKITMIGVLAKIVNLENNVTVTVVSTRCFLKCT